MQNGSRESLNGHFRDKYLNEHWLKSIQRARRITEAWRQVYNQLRPHGPIGDRTPAEVARRRDSLRSATPLSANPSETTLKPGLSPSLV